MLMNNKMWRQALLVGSNGRADHFRRRRVVLTPMFLPREQTKVAHAVVAAKFVYMVYMFVVAKRAAQAFRHLQPMLELPARSGHHQDVAPYIRSTCAIDSWRWTFGAPLDSSTNERVANGLFAHAKSDGECRTALAPSVAHDDRIVLRGFQGRAGGRCCAGTSAEAPALSPLERLRAVLARQIS